MPALCIPAFQSPLLLPWMTAHENVMLGVDQVFFTASKVERCEMAEYYLALAGLGDAMNKRAQKLSQGMRQRVGIARAFVLKPKKLLLEDREYYRCREHLIEFLNERSHIRPSAARAA